MSQAETLLKQIVDAIEANRTEDRRSFYPELVFEALPSGWLKSAKDAVAEATNVPQ